MFPQPQRSTLFPYTTLFRSIMFTGLTVKIVGLESASGKRLESASLVVQGPTRFGKRHTTDARWSADSVALTLDVHDAAFRSEEHTSELQSHSDLVCRLLLEK